MLRRRIARGLALLLSLLLVLSSEPLQAWDADRMLVAAQKLGPGAVAGALLLQPLLTSSRDLDEAGKLRAVNEFFNRYVGFRSDKQVWGLEDYWASPLEMLGKGAGDCEDFAIGKYFSLLALGVPTARLRLVYVRAQLGGTTQAHMVLAFYATPNAEPLILDNLITEIRPASRRPDLEPVFSFNSEGLWQGTGGQSAGDPAARLSKWREVLAKVRGEGFL